MDTKLVQTIQGLNVSSISDERKKTLQPLSDYLKVKIKNQEIININFICTHNSRRSFLGQIWMQTLANFFAISEITTYSGGTESTFIAPQVIKTLQEQGFQINKLSNEENPVYAVKDSQNVQPVIGFSKKIDHSFNPVDGFVAVMTCSQADGNCPFVAGAEKRFSITYQDPKSFDNTELESVKYKESSLQIANEMYYVLNQLNPK